MINFEPITQFVLECETNPGRVRVLELGQQYAIKFYPLRESNKWTALGPQGRIGDVSDIQQAINAIILDFELLSLIATKQIAFLDDTIGFYSEDPDKLRAHSKKAQGCVYTAIEDSPGCAVGRHLPVDLADLAEQESYSIITLLKHKSCPKNLVELGQRYLSKVQNLHDNINNWNSLGISIVGLNSVKQFKEQIRNFEYMPTNSYGDTEFAWKIEPTN